MRDHKKRLVVLPFSMGCATESSVAVGKKTKPKKKKPSAKDILPPPQTTRRKGEKEIKSATKMRNMRSYLTLPKYGFSKGVNRLIKGVKSFSLLPVYKEEEGEEMEQEMEIGLPTDVKHVTHIGWDGSSTVNPVKGWENVQAHEIMSFSSISLKQFELAMVAQASTEPIAVDSTKIR